MANQRNIVRIIGGKWRGRKLRFPSFADLRPSADRGRETLFNWLVAIVANSRCLDLFAGSGVLGFEALSRGAAHVTFVDVRAAVTSALRESQAQLFADEAGLAFASGIAAPTVTAADPARPDAFSFATAAIETAVSVQAPSATIVRADARTWLARPASVPAYDIAFLDPPFSSGLLPELLTQLQPHLRRRAWVYVERPKSLPALRLPDGWTLARQTRIGNVELLLLQTAASAPLRGSFDPAPSPPIQT